MCHQTWQGLWNPPLGFRCNTAWSWSGGSAGENAGLVLLSRFYIKITFQCRNHIFLFPDSGGDEEQFKGPEGRSIIGSLWKLNCWKGQTGQGAARVHRWMPEAVSLSVTFDNRSLSWGRLRRRVSQFNWRSWSEKKKKKNEKPDIWMRQTLNMLSNTSYSGVNQVCTAAHGTMDDLKWQQHGYMSQ